MRSWLWSYKCSHGLGNAHSHRLTSATEKPNINFVFKHNVPINLRIERMCRSEAYQFEKQINHFMHPGQWCCSDQRLRRYIIHDINSSPMPIYLAEENLNLSKRFPGVVKKKQLRAVETCAKCLLSGILRASGGLSDTCLNRVMWAVPRWVFRSLVSWNDSGEGDEATPEEASWLCVQRATYVKWQLVTPLSLNSLSQLMRAEKKKT